MFTITHRYISNPSYFGNLLINRLKNKIWRNNKGFKSLNIYRAFHKLPKIYTANHATFPILVHSRYTRMAGFGRREIEYMHMYNIHCIYNNYILCSSTIRYKHGMYLVGFGSDLRPLREIKPNCKNCNPKFVSLSVFNQILIRPTYTMT